MKIYRFFSVAFLFLNGCVYNEIERTHSTLRGDEYWEKVLNISHLPLISILNYRYYKKAKEDLLPPPPGPLY